MTSAGRHLILTLRGRLDQSRLDGLRASLGLLPHGFATGQTGNEVARRSYQHSQDSSVTTMIVTLTCINSEEWTIAVDAALGTDVVHWQSLIEPAIHAAGLTVVDRLETEVTMLRPETSEPSVYSVPSSSDWSTMPSSGPISLRRAEELVDKYFSEDPSDLGFTPVEHDRNRPTDLPLFTPGPRTSPVRRSALDDQALVQMARGLRGMHWLWLMDDLLGLGEVADDWIILESERDRITFDTQAVSGHGYIQGRGGFAETIDCPVATLADDVMGRAQLSAAFDRMATALSDVFGPPTSEIPGTRPEKQWAGEKDTLKLLHRSPSIRLVLQLNKARR
ncbi:DUF6301 family protein [Nocardia sienata]|uniref:DUF6301 family protein n=1 Tax=Nocardia sienata TaxID=248552 RepID=UPI000A7CA40A|nr:DUF6301 family protein [Nocardia sienata]